MQPIDETKETNITSSNVKSKYSYKGNVVSSVDNFREYKPSVQIEYKKRRNQMKHLIPKKKKRK